MHSFLACIHSIILIDYCLGIQVISNYFGKKRIAQKYDLGIMRGTEEAPDFMLGVVGVLRKGFLEEMKS